MTDLIINQLYNAYGFAPRQLMTVQKGYRNSSFPATMKDKQALNLIVYKAEPNILQKIKYANQVSDYLAINSIPARKTVSDRILRIKKANQTVYASLYTFLPGETIPWEAYTQTHIKLLGQMMAKMHKKLAKLKLDNTPSIEDEYKDLLIQMEKYFKQKGVESALGDKLNLSVNFSKLNDYKYVLAACKKILPRHMLHMDFVRGNILFRGFSSAELEISGVLDFEKTATGPRIVDIARTLAFLYVDCKYKPTQKVHRYFLISGYIRRGSCKFTDYKINNSSRKVSALDSLMEMFWVYDFYKFLRHNPYESLAKNQHFIRTARMLSERGVINAIASPQPAK